MRRCLDLAILGASTVSPNPMVGAVIVHNGTILGEGYTSPYGGPHAEVNAVTNAVASFGEEAAKRLFKNATIYVSLEPCAHYGKTPPCAEMLIALQFKEVVIGCLDPFAKVNGLGWQKLKDAGIDTRIGVLEGECKFVNRRFFTRIKEQRPYVILKWAQTADGYFGAADNTQQWISNKASTQLVHKWRGEEDAILVGTATALIDNPALTTRLWTGKNPKRILIDKALAVPDTAALLNDDAETIVFNALKTDWQSHKKLIALENFDLYLIQNILYQLYLMDVQSLLVEGGANTIQQFLDANVWDEARVFESEKTWGDGKTAPRIQHPAQQNIRVGSDQLYTYFNNG